MLPGVQGFHLALGMVADNQLILVVHLAVGGLVYPGDAVEGRRFSGAVGADEGDDFALVDVQRQAVHRHHAAKLHGDVPQFQRVISHGRHPPS